VHYGDCCILAFAVIFVFVDATFTRINDEQITADIALVENDLAWFVNLPFEFLHNMDEQETIRINKVINPELNPPHQVLDFLLRPFDCWFEGYFVEWDFTCLVLG